MSNMAGNFPVLPVGINPYNCVPNDPGIAGGSLVTWYPMDTRDTDQNNNLVYDTFCSDNHGTIIGTTPPFPIGADGLGQEGLRFTNNGGGISLPNNASFLPTGNANRSFFCWIYMFDFTNSTVPVFYGNTVSGNGTRFLLYVDSATSKLTFDPLGVTLTVATVLNTNTWYHVGFAYDNVVDATHVYLWLGGGNSGINAGYTALSLGAVSLNTGGGTGGPAHGIMTDVATSTFYGNAILRDWRCYNKFIDSTQAMMLMNRGIKQYGFGYGGQTEAALIPTVSASARFRRTLSPIGGRVGSRQIQGYMNG